MDSTLVATIICSWAGCYDTSYSSIEEADAFLMTKFGKSDSWLDLDDTDKVAALMTATQQIDLAYSWIGAKYYYNQALEFPRAISCPTNISEPSSDYLTLLLSSQEQILMQRFVKKACIEQAFSIMENAGENVHAKNKANGITSYSENYGNISESYSYRGGDIGSMLCPEAKKLLRQYRGQPRLLRG